MSQPLYYNFANNYASLDDIVSIQNAFQEIRDDIHQVFNVLGTVYEGEAADVLQQLHTGFSTEMEETLANIAITSKQANEQQQLIQQIDIGNANSLHG